MPPSIRITERVRLAATALFARAPSLSDFIYRWPNWRADRPDWQLVDLSAYITEGFNINSLVYDAIMYRARAAMSAPMRAYIGSTDAPELAAPDHPLQMVLARPNPYMSFPQLRMLQEIYLCLAGECFTAVARDTDGTPTHLWVMRPDRVQIIPNPNMSAKRWMQLGQAERKAATEDGNTPVIGYRYKPEGASDADVLPILAEDMIHVKLPNPNDPLDGLGHGLSPISPAAQAIDVDNHLTRLLKLFVKRGVSMPGVIEYPDAIDEDDVQAIKDKFREQHGGSDNWTDVGVIGRGGTWKPIGMTLKELVFGELDQRNETRIVGPFGVSPLLVGTQAGLDSSTYTNYPTARQIFWEDHMLPTNTLFETEFASKLNMEDAFVKTDLSDVPALRQDIAALTQAAFQMWQMGVPASDAFVRVGLEVPDFAGSHNSYLPFSVAPVGTNAPAPAEQTPQASPASEGQPPAAKSIPDLELTRQKNRATVLALVSQAKGIEDGEDAE